MEINKGSSDSGTSVKKSCVTGISLDFDSRSFQMDSAPLAMGAGINIGAHAYTTGQDIHFGPGADKHLAHEASHVVQQKR